MAFRDPTSTNTFIPSWEATGQIVASIRDPKKFRLNDYAVFKPATKPVGVYLVLESEHAIRVVSDEEYAWADGSVAPEGNDNLPGFEYREYRTERRAIPFNVGNRTRANTPWDIVAAGSGTVMSQEMTRITWKAVTALDTSGNWGTHTSSAATLSGVSGGKWDTSALSDSVIQKSLYAAFEAILQDTNSVVTMDMVRVVISPVAARKMRTSPEIMDYLKNSPFAMAQVKGELPNPNIDYGLPAKLYGFEFVVENAQRVSTRKNVGGTYTRGFIKDPDSAVMMSKQDVLPGEYASDAPGIPNFSTFQIFSYIGEQKPGAGKSPTWTKEDGSESGGYPFVLETKEDDDNRRLKGRVVSDLAYKFIMAESGYLISDILA